MKCSDLRDFYIDTAREYIANVISLDNCNNKICKVNIDYSANIIADNLNYIIINIGIYRRDESNNNTQLVENIYRYTSIGNLKEYFSIFVCDDEICKGCYSYIVKYNVINPVTVGTLRIVNSNIRLISEII